jgi:hypothetical protein
VNEDNTADQTDDERRAAGLSPKTSFPGQAAPKFRGPWLVNIAFWLLISGVAVLLLSQIYYLTVQDKVVDTAVSLNKNPKITADQLRQSVPIQLWVAFIAAVVFGLLIALFAYKAREGTRSARTVVTVLCVLTALFFFAIFSSLFAVFAILLFVIAVVMLYLPAVNPYFPKVGRKLT